MDDIPSSQSTSTPTSSTSFRSPTRTWVPSQDAYGKKSYSPGGKMASVYDATRTSTFRCDNVSYPADDYYVAFWTRYDSSLALNKNSQPAPINCGQRLKFTNPLTGLSASGVVLDRCASCIGVGDLSLNDPTTNEGLVNGATVDFSRELWNKIYNGAPGDVYDVVYVGDPLQGVS
ncbi:hypothetical protein D6C78_10997 [Aureobasidium pullulans]|uniref:Uncharacterized protein n=1 Tax=Aureobasidium pullulans TaxID=5580 RepID=A0A4T0B398_AURPU|nr:hypothetical protein D6C78_10997 [Aureobasidium pullulans]